MPEILKLAHERLGWPKKHEIMVPPGAGARALSATANRKLGDPIRRLTDCSSAQIGILSANPLSDATDPPLGLVCEFKKPVSNDSLREVQKLAWNFSLSPQLITVEPTLIRSFSCCEPPIHQDLSRYTVTRIEKNALTAKRKPLDQQAAQSLHWVNLVSGQFFRENDARFKRDKRADHMLLANLRSVRENLIDKQRLDEGICHDLLARMIFVQFLMDRKDKEGCAALDEDRMRRISRKEGWSREYGSLGEVLHSKTDTYKFFRFLNNKFNGDLFSGVATSEKNGKSEEKKVKAAHLKTLACFIDGDYEMSRGQQCLWKQYSFDVIPLEFISSIYEEFVSLKDRDSGAHYTPPYLVDFVLDGVLPWGKKRWNLKILDPACGSGIFLVKAFQRLISRWKCANPRQKPSVDVLRKILTENLFGVDNNDHAVRVASFSLYLAMCDEIDPIQLWQRVRFPNIRENRVVHADFFDEDKVGFCVQEDSRSYDIVVGNAPWGKDTATEAAKAWATRDPDDQWNVPYKNPGPLFLPKSAALAKKTGIVSMLQPAQTLLANQQRIAQAFRFKFFQRFNVEEIVNLSALRFGLFKNSVSPACLITLRPTPSKGDPIAYVCPKPKCTREDDHFLVIEPHDINFVLPNEAKCDPFVWSILMHGSRRDYYFVKSLQNEQTLAGFRESGDVIAREGVIRGDRKRTQDVILNKPILDLYSFPPDVFLVLKPDLLPINQNAETDGKASTNFSAFSIPQLILKKSWTTTERRFRSTLVDSTTGSRGVICSDSYVSIHSANSQLLESACLTYNSILAVYYLFMISGRCAAGYRYNVKVRDLLSVPIPKLHDWIAKSGATFKDVDDWVKSAFEIDDARWALVEDMWKCARPGDGRQPTKRPDADARIDPGLQLYCGYFQQVIESGFGKDKNVSFTIFSEPKGVRLPVRLVAVHLGGPRERGVQITRIECATLLDLLVSLYHKHMHENVSHGGGVGYIRSCRIYDAAQVENHRVPTVYIVKPDQFRYWTRSVALRDADEVVDDIMSWWSHADPADRELRK